MTSITEHEDKLIENIKKDIFDSLNKHLGDKIKPEAYRIGVTAFVSSVINFIHIISEHDKDEFKNHMLTFITGLLGYFILDKECENCNKELH